LESAFNPLATAAGKMKYRSLGERSIDLLPGQYFDEELNRHDSEREIQSWV